MDLSITILITLESNLRLRDAISTVEGLLDRAVELNYKMVAITEHDSLSSHIRAQKYYNKLKEKNPDLDLKLILGNEIYLVRNGLNASNYDSTQDRYFHFILIALDETGHTQLQELSTRAWGRSYVSRGHRRVPTYYQDLFDIVQKDPGHLVATSACLGGIVGTQLLRWQESGKVPSHYEQIVKWVNQMNSLFGQGYFFLEMQPSRNEEQIFVNKEIIKISHQTNVPTIINLDAHYLKKEDRPIHKAFLTSQPGPREVDAFYATTYLMDTEEIVDYMKTHLSEEEIHKAFDGSMQVYKLVKEYDLRKPLHIPYLVNGLKDPTINQIEKWKKEIPLIETFYESEYISDRHLVTQILKRLEIDETLQNKETYDEIGRNLESIKLSSEVMHTPWSAYLLNVQETVDTIWSVDAIVGCARGSVTGFLLAYILGITQINPLREKTKTYAFRFLNPQRVSPLDIDLDSPASKRQVIYKALEDKYGKDHIARVATFKTEKAKSAILTAARGLGIGVEEASYLSTLVTSERGFTRSLSQMYYGDVEAGISANKEFKRVMDNEYPELWKVATYIENLISGMSSHSSGVIVTDEPIYLSTALMKTNGGDIVTQYDLHDCEEVSLIKQDLLTVETLDRIQTTLELLIEQKYVTPEPTWRETYEKVIGIYNIERDDPKMWEKLWNHEVQSFFQMEQQSGVQGIELVKPESVDDLAVLNSVNYIAA